MGGIEELDPDVETLAFPHFTQRGFCPNRL
jgi:hypothetical protein